MDKESKKCFIITPIDSPQSPVRRATDGLLDSVIIPILNDLNYKTFVSHRISELGSITGTVIEHLLDDDLVVANLTSLNPNVMYELAVRHAKAKVVIVLAEVGTKLPFDIAGERVIFYINDMQGVVELKKDFKDMVQNLTKDESLDNPIYRVVKEQLISKDVKKGSELEYLLKEIKDLKGSIDGIQQSNSNKSLKFSSDPNLFKDYFTEDPESYKLALDVIKKKYKINVKQ